MARMLKDGASNNNSDASNNLILTSRTSRKLLTARNQDNQIRSEEAKQGQNFKVIDNNAVTPINKGNYAAKFRDTICNTGTQNSAVQSLKKLAIFQNDPGLIKSLEEKLTKSSNASEKINKLLKRFLERRRLVRKIIDDKFETLIRNKTIIGSKMNYPSSILESLKTFTDTLFSSNFSYQNANIDFSDLFEFINERLYSNKNQSKSFLKKLENTQNIQKIKQKIDSIFNTSTDKIERYFLAKNIDDSIFKFSLMQILFNDKKFNNYLEHIFNEKNSTVLLTKKSMFKKSIFKFELIAEKHSYKLFEDLITFYNVDFKDDYAGKTIFDFIFKNFSDENLKKIIFLKNKINNDEDNLKWFNSNIDETSFNFSFDKLNVFEQLNANLMISILKGDFDSLFANSMDTNNLLETIKYNFLITKHKDKHFFNNAHIILSSLSSSSKEHINSSSFLYLKKLSSLIYPLDALKTQGFSTPTSAESKLGFSTVMINSPFFYDVLNLQELSKSVNYLKDILNQKDTFIEKSNHFKSRLEKVDSNDLMVIRQLYMNLLGLKEHKLNLNNDSKLDFNTSKKLDFKFSDENEFGFLLPNESLLKINIKNKEVKLDQKVLFKQYINNPDYIYSDFSSEYLINFLTEIVEPTFPNSCSLRNDIFLKKFRELIILHQDSLSPKNFFSTEMVHSDNVQLPQSEDSFPIVNVNQFQDYFDQNNGLFLGSDNQVPFDLIDKLNILKEKGVELIFINLNYFEFNRKLEDFFESNEDAESFFDSESILTNETKTFLNSAKQQNIKVLPSFFELKNNAFKEKEFNNELRSIAKFIHFKTEGHRYLICANYSLIKIAHFLAIPSVSFDQSHNVKFSTSPKKSP